MTDWGKLLSKAELNKAIREKKKTYLEKTAWRSSQAEEESEGWAYHKDLKNPKKIKMRKPKPNDEVFENRVWVLFAQMGFHTLNRDRDFKINYSQQGKELTKQIDVFAADDETVLVIECKCADTPKSQTWKTELEAINGYKSAVIAEIRKEFPKHNVKFIFATNNYIVGDKDKERMTEFKIAHFDENTIKYYEELVKHLGSCARYQLLGSLFANTEIKGMKNLIPAIQGKMGGYTYYAFSIQPETLLKIGYVLHRSEANEAMMPTYQRIIKKSRLKSVHEFIENHGFFPNSIVISIDSKSKLQFDLSEKQGSDDIAKLGILHLPNRYRSAYIIDGQHRLYGYSDSKYAKTNSIPVVAFENMDQKEQVKLFMEINQNQKAVSKNLRNTLNADLLWVSDDPKERREALRSKIAQEMGDNLSSPLRSRVVIGEDQSDDFKCITLEMICSAIDATSLLSKYGKDKALQEHGLMDLDDNEKTSDLLMKYLFGCFNYLKELLPEEWDKNPKKDGILLFNTAIGGLIRLFGDIAIELHDKGYDPKDINDFLEETHYYLDPLQNYIRNLDTEEKNELRYSYGANGPRDYWRKVEKAVHEVRSEFLPEGYEKYWEDHGKVYNEESIGIMKKVEVAARNYIHSTLTSNSNGDNWILSIPKKTFTKAAEKQSKDKYNNNGVEKDIWEFFGLDDFREIIIYGNNWTSYFDQTFTLPSEAKKKGGKKAKTEWLSTIGKMQNQIGRANFSVSKADYEMLKEVEGIINAMK